MQKIQTTNKQTENKNKSSFPLPSVFTQYTKTRASSPPPVFDGLQYPNLFASIPALSPFMDYYNMQAYGAVVPFPDWPGNETNAMFMDYYNMQAYGVLWSRFQIGLGMRLMLCLHTGGVCV